MGETEGRAFVREKRNLSFDALLRRARNIDIQRAKTQGGKLDSDANSQERVAKMTSKQQSWGKCTKGRATRPARFCSFLTGVSPLPCLRLETSKGEPSRHIPLPVKSSLLLFEEGGNVVELKEGGLIIGPGFPRDWDVGAEDGGS